MIGRAFPTSGITGPGSGSSSPRRARADSSRPRGLTGTGLDAVAFWNWTRAALAALRGRENTGTTVLCRRTRSWRGRSRSSEAKGGDVQFVDCNSGGPVCVSFADSQGEGGASSSARRVPRAHRGSPRGRESDEIAELCRERDIFLIEDCAHAHGAQWDWRRAGSWGSTAGVWSFAATKTISTGEGGRLVSKLRRRDRACARLPNYRNRTTTPGLNFRMKRVHGRPGRVGVERLGRDRQATGRTLSAREQLDPLHPESSRNRGDDLQLHCKYVVFDPVERSTGRCRARRAIASSATTSSLPQPDWVAANHWVRTALLPTRKRRPRRRRALAR